MRGLLSLCQMTGVSENCGCGEADRRMLEGPRSRTREFFTLMRVLRDFVRGFRALHFVGPCVTVFGSARVREPNRYYDLGATNLPAPYATPCSSETRPTG